MTSPTPPQILIHRVPHNAEHPYVMINQITAQDSRLSLAARGLLTYILSLKDDWHVEPQHLARVLALNVETVRKLLKELVMYGYVKPREKQCGALGQILWTHYQVYERPHTDEPISDVALARTIMIKHKQLSGTVSKDGFSEHAGSEALVNKDSRKKEKESPAENLDGDTPTESPNGDAHAVSASLCENDQPQPQPEKAFLVKADDSFKILSLPNREQFLSVSQAAELPVAAPPTAAKSAEQGPRDAKPAAAKVAKSADLMPVSRAAKPVIDVPRAAPKSPPASRAAPKSSTVQPIAHSHISTPPINPNLMQAVVAHAFRVGQGAYAGKIGQFLQGKMPRRRKDTWSQFQPDIPASPQEIMALLLWYRQYPAYAQSFTEHGSKLPLTPSILRDRLDEFRDSVGYASAMQAAVPLLDTLMRGESIAAPMSVKSPPTSPIESAAAYTGYASDIDRAYGRKTDSSTTDIFETLFGEPS